MLNTLLVSSAIAQDAGAAVATPSPVSGMIPLIFIFVVFYFLLIRPQQKKFKAHQAMIAAVEKGDEVITAGGVYGKITKIEDTTATVRIAEGVEVKIDRATLSSVLNKEEKAK